MDLHIFWHKPITLEDGDKKDLIFDADGIEDYNGKPGVYVFCRKYGDRLRPLYIGKAANIGSRIRQQFKNNLKLMKQIEKAKSGVKVLVIGEFKRKSVQDTDTAITLIEKALIRQALAMGHELLNISGTKIPAHRMNFSGNLDAKKFSRNKILLERA